jgi:hypothetical protein
MPGPHECTPIIEHLDRGADRLKRSPASAHGHRVVTCRDIAAETDGQRLPPAPVDWWVVVIEGRESHEHKETKRPIRQVTPQSIDGFDVASSHQDFTRKPPPSPTCQ